MLTDEQKNAVDHAQKILRAVQLYSYAELLAAHSAGAKEPVAYTSADRLKRIAERNRHVDTMWPASMRDEGDIPHYTHPQPMTGSAGAQAEPVAIVRDYPATLGTIIEATISLPLGTKLYPHPRPTTDAAWEVLSEDALMQAIADTAARGHVWASRALSDYFALMKSRLDALSEIERIDRAGEE